MKRREKKNRVFSIHCNCHCPHWQKEHGNLWEVKCECGRVEVACGYCVVAGRVRACLDCGRKELIESN